MKKSLLLCAALLVISATAARALEISARLAINVVALKPAGQQLVDLYGTQNGPIELAARFKDGASRTELPANAGSGLASQVLIVTTTGLVNQLDPASKFYTTWPRKAAAAAPKIAPTRTGQKQTIAGFTCEQLIFDLGQGEVWEYWVTQDIPGVSAMDVADNALDARRRAMFRQLGGVPIRTINTMPNFRLTSDILSLKLEPQNAAYFEIPADYAYAKDVSDLNKKKEKR
jgi:hypothetical protein